MKKRFLWTLILIGILSACEKTNQKSTENLQPVEEKTVEKEESALRYKMFKAEDAQVGQVANLFKDFLEEEGMYYPRFLDFQAAAQIDNVEFPMKPAVLVIFGHPKEMGVLIRENPEAAVDLPFRILIYENEEGEVWVMYKDFEAFKKQFFLTDNDNIIPKYEKLLDGFEEKLPAYLNKIKQRQASE